MLLVSKIKDNLINVLCFNKEEKNNYGKVILGPDGYISEIVEQKELKKNENFEIIGLSRSMVESFFPGMSSRISGIGLDGLEKRVRRQHEVSFKSNNVILDIGGESTKPNAEYVSEKEEANRVLKVIKALSKKGYLVSADTRKHLVMEKAIDNGAKIKLEFIKQ